MKINFLFQLITRFLLFLLGVIIIFYGLYIESIFNSIWQDGLNMNDENIVQKVLKNLNINPKTFLMDAIDSSIKEDLKKRTDLAFKKGIFGAPSFIVNNKVFWGQDRLDFVITEAQK